MTDDEMLALVSKDDVSGLSVLTSGPIPPNPAELLGSDQMRRLMAFAGKFNHVVVDSPPVTSFTDGVLIASIVDGVLLVVHGGKSSRHVVKRSRQLLKDVGAKIFGVVLNNVNLQSHDYYYYQRYYGVHAYKADFEVASKLVRPSAGFHLMGAPSLRVHPSVGAPFSGGDRGRLMERMKKQTERSRERGILEMRLKKK